MQPPPEPLVCVWATALAVTSVLFGTLVASPATWPRATRQHASAQLARRIAHNCAFLRVLQLHGLPCGVLGLGSFSAVSVASLRWVCAWAGMVLAGTASLFSFASTAPFNARVFAVEVCCAVLCCPALWFGCASQGPACTRHWRPDGSRGDHPCASGGHGQRRACVPCPDCRRPHLCCVRLTRSGLSCVSPRVPVCLYLGSWACSS